MPPKEAGSNGNPTDSKDSGKTNNGKAKVKAPRKKPPPPALPPPPDGGWGWMIVVASFMISVLVDGVCFSAGIFFNPFRSYFGTTKAETAWVGSVLNGSYLTVGPLVSACVNRFGCRPVAMFGSVFAATAFFISTFSPNMPVLIITYGFFGGIGFGFVYLPAIVMVGYYFEKRRALATGVACCGSGIGAFMFAPLCNSLLEVYAWKGATWILAGLVLNALVFSIFYRPLEHPKVDLKVVEENGAKVKDTDIVQVKVEALDAEQTRALLGGDTAEDGWEEEAGEKAKAVNPAPAPAPANPLDAGDTSTTTVTTVAETSTTTTAATTPSIPTIVLPGGEKEEGGKEGEKEQNGNAQPTLQDLIQTVTPEIHRVQSAESKTFMSDFQLADSTSPVARMAFSQDVFSHNHLKKRQPHRHHHHHHHHHHSHHHHSHNYLEVDNPLQRRDIFYSGSLRNIPEFQSAHSLAEYRQKVTIRPCQDSEGEEEEEGGEGGGDSVGDEESIVSRRRSFFKRILCDPLLAIFDVSLLRSPTFVIYGLSCLLCMLGFFVPFIYLPTLCIDLGISATKAAFLISIIGIANTISRVVVGFVSDQPWADCLLINNVALIVGGLATCLVPFLHIYALFATYTFIFGTSIAIFVSLRSIIMVELMGLQKLTNAFGLVIMCQGISSFVGAPIAGVLSDMTGDYNISFYVAGICLGASGIICFPLRRIARWEQEREKRKLEEKRSAQLVKNKSS